MILAVAFDFARIRERHGKIKSRSIERNMKIKVKPEGRKDIWIPEKESLKAWIKSKNFEQIHNFLPSSFAMIGADYEVKSVLEDVDSAERIAILTGEAWVSQLKHALSIISKNRLEIYDIGEVTEEDLEVNNP